MPRKSSFLMGFETGADLYNRGYSQAMSLAQMKQQQEERKYQRGRDEKEDRLAQDLASQRKKRFELELKKAAQEEKINNTKFENLTKGSQALKKANEWFSVSDPINNQADYEEWTAYVRPRLHSDAHANIDTGKSFDALSDLIKDGRIHKNTVQARAQQDANLDADNVALREINANRRKNLEKWREFGLTSTMPSYNQDKKIADKVGLIASKLENGILPNGTSSEEVLKFVSEFEGDKESLNTYFEKAFTKREGALIKIGDEGKGVSSYNLKLENQFNEYKSKVGKPNWDFNEPSDRAEAVTHQQISENIDDFSEGGLKGIALLKSLKPMTDGGFDQIQLADAKAKLVELKADVKKRGQRINLTEVQGKALMYGVAMYQAQLEFDALASEGYIALTPKDRAAAFIAGKAGDITFAGVSEKGQRYLAAMQNWNNAKLRKDSGAAITVAEVENYTASLFPRLGDKPGAIAAKQRQRDAAYFGLKKSAGPDLKEFWEELEAGLNIPSTITTDGAENPTTAQKGGSSRRMNVKPPVSNSSSNKTIAHTFTGTVEQNRKKFEELRQAGEIKEGDVIKILGADGVLREMVVEGAGDPTPKPPVSQTSRIETPPTPVPNTPGPQPESYPPQRVQSPEIGEVLDLATDKVTTKLSALYKVLTNEDLRNKAIRRLMPSMEETRPVPDPDSSYTTEGFEPNEPAPGPSGLLVGPDMDEGDVRDYVEAPRIESPPTDSYEPMSASLAPSQMVDIPSPELGKLIEPILSGADGGGEVLYQLLTNEDLRDKAIQQLIPKLEERIPPSRESMKGIPPLPTGEEEMEKEKTDPSNLEVLQEAAKEISKEVGKKGDALSKVLKDKELREKFLQELLKQFKK